MKDLTILRIKRPSLWIQLLEPRILLAKQSFRIHRIHMMSEKFVTFENFNKLFIKSDPEEALNVLESGKVSKSDPNWNEFKILISFLSVV